LSVISAAFMAFCGTRQHREIAEAEEGGETNGQILLVGENQKNGVPQLVLVQHALQFLPGLDDTVAIVGVDDEDDALSVLEVVPPEGADLVLASDVPHRKLDVLVLDRLHIEACEGLATAATATGTDGPHQWWEWS